MAEFKKPDFSTGILELRYENNEICIYGTTGGLKKLSNLIQNLIQNPGQGHVHLEDYGILTGISLPGAVAIFEDKK